MADPKFEDTLPLEDVAPTFEETTALDEPTSDGIQVPQTVQRIGQAITTPIRGFRGLGVVAERVGRELGRSALIPGQTPTPQQLGQAAQAIPEALQRGAAAVQPGFQPETGREAIAAGVGEAVGVGGLTLGVPVAGTTAHQIATGAGLAGGLTLLEQISEKGEINPVSVGGWGAFGAALPVIRPAIVSVKNFSQKFLPAFLKRTAGIPENATKTLMQNPNVQRQFTGAEDVINQKVQTIQNGLKQTLRQAGDVLDRAYKRAGIRDSDVQRLTRIARGEEAVRSSEELAAIVLDLPKTVKALPSKKDKLRFLLNLQQDLNAHVNFSKSGQLPPISDATQQLFKKKASQIGELLNTFPEGRFIQRARKGYAGARNIYEDLRRQLQTEGKAEDFLEKVFQGEAKLNITGRHKENIKALRRLEKETGQKLLEPLFGEFTAQAFEPVIPVQGLGTILSFGGAATFLLGNPAIGAAVLASAIPRFAGIGIKTGAAAGKILEQVAKTASTPAGIAGITQATRRLLGQ